MPIGRACGWALWARCYKLLQILSHRIARCAIVRFVVTHFGAHKINSIIDNAIDAAVAVIQDAIGQTDGGFAAHYLTGERLDALRAILTDYARAELDARIAHLETHEPQSEAEKWAQCDEYAQAIALREIAN